LDILSDERRPSRSDALHAQLNLGGMPPLSPEDHTRTLNYARPKLGDEGLCHAYDIGPVMSPRTVFGPSRESMFAPRD
jgi:hypothetical protein